MMRADSRNRARNPPTVGRSFDDLERDVASLPALDTAALRQRWKALFGADPSPHFGRSVLVGAISYRIQERVFGGLKPATQRVLDRTRKAVWRTLSSALRTRAPVRAQY